MRSIWILLLTVLPVVAAQAHQGDGMMKMLSTKSFESTVKDFQTALKDNGLTLFTMVDHQANAKKVGEQLLPSTLFIFGNPKLGTKLMHCGHSVALDLPMKALVWQDDKGKVWVSYNDPAYLKKRHHLDTCQEALDKATAALFKLTSSVVE